MHLLASILAFFITFAITTLCLAWAPFAALICARLARQRCLNTNRPALHGAIYAALLFLPWRHLIRQMRGDPITRAKINSAYFFAYLLAALVLASHIAVVLAYPYPSYSLNIFAEIVDFIITTTIGAIAFIIGLISLSRAKNRRNHIQDQPESPNAIDLPNKSYIAPFAWAWATMLISVAPWYYRFIAVLIWTSLIDR